MENVFIIFLFILELLPGRGLYDISFRYDIAEAIVSVTDNIQEQKTLARIIRWESGYRKNVFRCEKKGDKGKSLGLFQIQPMSEYDKKLACGTLYQQTSLALRYMRRASEMCPDNTGAAKLNLYVSGRCNYGIEESRKRWEEE